MSLDTCPRCKANTMLPCHRCPPLWEVCDPEQDSDDWRELSAPTGGEAAEEFARQIDASDSSMEQYRAVLVRTAGESAATCYEVAADIDITYTAIRRVRT